MGTLKTRDWKSRDWKTRDEMTGVENAGLENARPTKYGKPNITLSAAYIVNDNRIKMCLRRFDDNSYTRMQFLRAVSHSVGAHSSKLCDGPTDSDTSPRPIKNNLTLKHKRRCRDRRHTRQRHERLQCIPRGSIAFVKCCHQRFCEACAKDVERQGRGCPICGTDIRMILCLFSRSFEIR